MIKNDTNCSLTLSASLWPAPPGPATRAKNNRKFLRLFFCAFLLGKSKTTQLLKDMGQKSVIAVEGRGRGTKYIIQGPTVKISDIY